MREGWISCAIGDVVEQVKRVQSLNDNEQYRLLGVRWYGMGAFHRETVTTASSKANKFFRVHTGDFIYNRLFAWKGAFAVIEDELDGHCVSGEFPVFRTDPERLLPEYLFHYMARPQIWDRILLESTGSTATSRNRWKEDRFLSMEIDLPPIDVQRRIVDLISSIDDAIRAGTTYKHLLQTSRSQLLAAILSSHEGWLETRLADIAFEVTDRVNPNDVADTRYVGLEHIDSGHHVLQRYGDSTDVVSHKTRFKAGDILFGKLRPYLRKSALATFDGMCSTDILVFRARPGMVMPEYLALILQTPGAFEHAERTSAGTRMPRTSARAMMGLRVLCPPLGEQRRIVDLISSIDQALSRIDTVRTKAAQLRQAVLNDLIAGNHTIPDSYDHLLEDAS